ncbi:MAG: caspase family protein [Caldilineaceae bacterium]|nr:caspase family protein [Caldilineaceae bacterium]
MTSTTDTRHVRLIEPSKISKLITHYYDQSWGLVIGINDYGGEHATLANARNDAVAFAELLRTAYKFEQVYTLYDQAATYATIMAWLRDKLPAQIGKNDRLVIFFAGHGTTRESRRGHKHGYLVPHDAQGGSYADYIDMAELLNACGWIPAKHILLILDCCFSGVAAITVRSTPATNQQVMTDAYLQEITRRPAWQVLTAGASDELAADSGSRPGHSAFTSALLAGLEGQADQNSDGIITASELAGFVKPEVSRQSMGGRLRGQTPFFNYLAGSGQGDFVFIRHDTPVKIQPQAGVSTILTPARLSPTVIALGLVLLVAIGVLSWVLKNAWEYNDVIDQHLANYEATTAANAEAIATNDAKTLAAATGAPPLTQTAIAAQQTANAMEVATRVAATSAAIAAGTPIPTEMALSLVTPQPTATTPAQRQATATSPPKTLPVPTATTPAQATTPSCAPVSNPPLQVGDQGKICLAKSADLGLRDDPSSSRSSIRLKNGTQFTVTGPARCAYYSYANQYYFWWPVETITGRKGWLVDASDGDDPVYLCRIGGDVPTDVSTPTTIDADETTERTSAEVVQALTHYWSLWGSTRGCLAAWGLLSDLFEHNPKDLSPEEYLTNCEKTQARVAQVYDLDLTTTSVIEMRGSCALVRVQLSYDGSLTNITFGLLQSQPNSGVWQIYSSHRDHQKAQARADEVCP